jgi:hypothetical protein
MAASHPQLPGADLITAGLADLARGVESGPALLVSIGAPRLEALGVQVERALPDAERRLYEQLRRRDSDGAHSRYNALIRRLVSFERALACARLADRDRVRRFMEQLAAEAHEDARVYFTGGATALLSGWRDSTIGVDMKLAPEQDVLLRAIPRLKESLQLNVELASPADFIPVPAGWEDRSPFIVRLGRVSFHHFDLYAQALAKVERGHSQDITDVGEMLGRALVERPRALAFFSRIEPELHRYPAIDPPTFRRAVHRAFGSG